MKKIISVIGAGGKTTLIHRLAEEYQRKGNAVLVTTTTHMFAEPGTDLSGDAFSIREKLQRDHYCMAGIQCSENPQKMQALPEHTLRAALCGYCSDRSGRSETSFSEISFRGRTGDFFGNDGSLSRAWNVGYWETL